MGLFDLPQEIILSIFTADNILQKRDLLALALTSKYTSYLAMPVIYRHVLFDVRKDTTVTFGLLLNTIVSCPELAAMVQSVKLTWPGYSHDIRTDCVDLLVNMQIRGNLTRLLAHLPLLQDIELKIHEKDYVRNPSPLVAFKTAEIEGFPRLQPILDLCQLGAVRKLCLDDPGVTAVDIRRYMSLPAIECLQIERFNVFTSTDDLSGVSNLPITSLKSLHFGKSSVPASGVTATLLQHCQAVKTLTWDMSLHLARLMKTKSVSFLGLHGALQPLRHTLVELHLTGQIEYEMPPLCTSDGLVLDFREFTSLRTLEVHDIFLFARQNRHRELYSRLPPNIVTLNVSKMYRIALFLLTTSKNALLKKSKR